MNYGEILKSDIANGIGMRVSLFVSGCTHHCKGCFNEMTWDFSYGMAFTAETEDIIFKACEPDYVHGLTLLGGEPFEPENQAVLTPFLQRWKAKFPRKNVWCYTGCVYETQLLGPSHWRTDNTDAMLSMIDILVDGPFVEELKDISLKFRGSSNQRILNLAEMRKP